PPGAMNWSMILRKVSYQDIRRLRPSRIPFMIKVLSMQPCQAQDPLSLDYSSKNQNGRWKAAIIIYLNPSCNPLSFSKTLGQQDPDYCSLNNCFAFLRLYR